MSKGFCTRSQPSGPVRGLVSSLFQIPPGNMTHSSRAHFITDRISAHSWSVRLRCLPLGFVFHSSTRQMFIVHLLCVKHLGPRDRYFGKQYLPQSVTNGTQHGAQNKPQSTLLWSECEMSHTHPPPGSCILTFDPHPVVLF